MPGYIENEKERYHTWNWNYHSCTSYAAFYADKQRRRRRPDSGYPGWKGIWNLFSGKGSGYNKIRVEDGKAYMEEANCPDGYCEEQGKISRHTQTIVCLPHKLVVEVLESDNGKKENEDEIPDTIAK